MNRSTRILDSRFRHGCRGCGAKSPNDCVCTEEDLETYRPRWTWEGIGDGYDNNVLCANCDRNYDEHLNRKCLFSSTQWLPSMREWEQVDTEHGHRYVETVVIVSLTYEPLKASFLDSMKYRWRGGSKR